MNIVLQLCERLGCPNCGEASVQVQVDGKVTSGRGHAKDHIFAHQDEVLAIVGQALCPGSLNIILNRPLRFVDSAAFCFDGERRMLWPASLNGIDVWLYRWRECPLHIVEVLSSVHLRQRFDLKDGDEVTLSLNDEEIGAMRPTEFITWEALWAGRRNWHYSVNKYCVLCTMLGAAQQRPVVRPRHGSLMALKETIKRIPIVGPLAKAVASKLAANGRRGEYAFSRVETEDCADREERLLRQVQNVLNYTKTSQSVYSAMEYPAGYHTIEVNGQRVAGQRDPSKRLALVPFDFRDKTVLDLGCNQGGMIHQLAGVVKWAVGIDYDPHMINAANRIRCAMRAENTSFYVLDLQKEPLSLITDFMPDPRADICFLLSVCMWLENWREVIDFAQSKSESMLFETNGSPSQQQDQIDYLRTKYAQADLLSETSEDDTSQKLRKLFYLGRPVILK